MARHFTAASNDYIDCGTGVRGSDVQKITVAAWINRDTTADGTVAARWNNSVNESWLLAVGANKLNLVILATDNNAYSVAGATVLGTGTWTHVAGSYDGSVLRVYVNGNLDGANTVNKVMKFGTLAMQIGNKLDGGAFNGSIAELTVMLDTLNSPRMIASLAEGASPSDMEGLSNFFHIGYWPLLGDNPEVDLTPSNNKGTLHGTTAVAHPPVRSGVAFL